MKLRIQKAVYGGAGLARIAEKPLEEALDAPAADSRDGPSLAGKAVFTPYALPGELVEAHIAEDRRGFSTAELDSVLEPSPERTPPRCEYFPACGGCQYQHANAAYQLRMKLDILRDTLERAHLGSHLPSLDAIAVLSGPPWGYRNRIRLQVAQKHGGLALCYRARGTHSNLPVTHCPIAAPVLERAIAAVLEIGREGIGQGSGLAGLCEEIEFFTNDEEAALLVSLWTSRPLRSNDPQGDKGFQGFAAQLKIRVPELTGAGLFSAGDRSERLLSQWDQPSLTYTVSGHKYQAGLGSFFQVNRFLLPQLVDLVTGHCSGRIAWDLYAGVGLFARALDFEHVTAVEANPFSAADLKYNLSGTSRRAIRSTTLAFLQNQARQRPRDRPDLILLDPPRAGLGKYICAHLAEIAAPKMIYVSCDPATLARDLQTLLRSEYRLKKVHLVDLFPQTFHLETVVMLGRE